MTTPVQISFRNMTSSPGLDEDIRALVDRLATVHPRLEGCRVLVETPHRHRHRGRPVHVRVELSFPGEDVIVSRNAAPVTLARPRGFGHVTRAPHEHVRVAIHDAFEIAGRRVAEMARERHDHR